MRSKLQPPALPRESVPRPRLLDVLGSGRSSALTLVCAPPGYGKTTLLSQWAEAAAGTTRFAWVTLDDGDADPVRFWTYLVSALSTVAASAGQRSLPALGRHPERMTAEFLPLLVEELEDGDQDLILVLEDYHRARSCRACAARCATRSPERNTRPRPCASWIAPTCSSARSTAIGAGTGTTSCSPRHSGWNWKSPSRS